MNFLWKMSIFKGEISIVVHEQHWMGLGGNVVLFMSDIMGRDKIHLCHHHLFRKVLWFFEFEFLNFLIFFWKFSKKSKNLCHQHRFRYSREWVVRKFNIESAFVEFLRSPRSTAHLQLWLKCGGPRLRFDTFERRNLPLLAAHGFSQWDARCRLWKFSLLRRMTWPVSERKVPHRRRSCLSRLELVELVELVEWVLDPYPTWISMRCSSIAKMKMNELFIHIETENEWLVHP